ncbi:MAG: hypothetical protein M3Q70_03370 [bacterium]|nr:hypothetical protein [bacterium]
MDAVTQMDHVTLKRINHGPLFVGNNYSATNMVDQQQLSKIYTNSSSSLILDAGGTGSGLVTLTSAGAISGVTTLNTSGLITSVGLNSGTGLIQGTGGLTITGTSSLAAINASGAYTQSGAGANTFTGASTFSAAGTGLAVTNNATIGGTLAVTGAVTGGTYNGQTISSAASFTGTVTAATSFTAPFYNVTAATGNGICFWTDCTNYKIHMGTGAEYQYGPVTDYSIKMNMNGTAGRGWTWGQPGVAPIAALGNTGNMQIAGTLTSGLINGQTISSAANFTGTLTAASTIQGTRLISTVATGTAPLTVTSTTLVDNLNVEMLGGYTESQLGASLRSGYMASGGGTVGYNTTGTGVSWSSRFIVISNSKGTDFAASGYFDIAQPIDGTVITGANTANITVAGGAIPLPAWCALYYILPIGSANTSLPANFRVVCYTGSNFSIPSNWVLLASHNADNTTMRFVNGLVLRSGQSGTAGSVNNVTFNTSATSPLFVSTVATGTAPLTVTSTTKVTNLNVDLLDGLDSTAFALTSGDGDYIQNTTVQQTSSNFNISGAGVIGTTLTVASTSTLTGAVGIGAAPAANTKLSLNNGELGIGQQSDATPYLRLGMDSGYTQYLANNAYWTGTAYNYVNTAGYGGTASRMYQASGTIGFDTASGATNPITWVNRLLIANNGAITAGGTFNGQTISSAANFTGTLAVATSVTSPIFNATNRFEGNAADTVTTPSFTWTGDTNTGIFRPAADVLAITTGGTEALRVLANGNVGIGTAAPDTTLEVRGATLNSDAAGAVNYYRSVAHGYIGAATQTGTVKIALPTSWTNTMLSITIKGYDYTGNTGAWEVVVSGYNYAAGTAWINTSAEIRGKAPFTQVRLAHDGTKNVILLGGLTTAWNYSSVEVTDVAAGFSAKTGWGSGWAISLLASEAGITNINTPVAPMTVGAGNDITTAADLLISGGDLTLSGTSTITAGGAQSLYSALSISGTKNGYGGINFRDGATNLGTLMVTSSIQGFLNEADNAWDWYFADGVLTAGSVPVARITGTLPVANGGTGQTTLQAAINSLSGLTTNGDLLYHNGTNSTRLARGTTGQCLTSNVTTLIWAGCGGGAEADTLATVTARGATTATASTFSGGLTASGAGTGLSVTNNAAFDTNTLFVDATNNRVGIGTASPLYKFHANTGINQNFILRPATDFTIDVGSGVGFQSVNDADNAYQGLQFEASSVGFNLNSGGSVGIGIAPSGTYKLEVSGTLGTTGYITMREASPTLVFRDTDNKTGFIHVNSDLMYFLSGTGVDSSTWTPNGTSWALTVNLATDQVSIGGNLNITDGGTITNTSATESGRVRIADSAMIDDILVFGSQTVTLTDNGIGDTVTPTATYVKIDIDESANAGTPLMGLSETGAADGQLLIMTNIESDGTHTGWTWDESPGVWEVVGNADLTMGYLDAVQCIYAVDRWIMIGYSDN